MKIPATNAGANYLHVLCFIACIVVSLAPAVVGPPERSFSPGQPELQQAMDNMVSHELYMKRDPSTHEESLPILLTKRLLDDAELLLAEAKDTKEKQWMQSFVHKLQGLASALHHTAQTPEIDTKDKTTQSLTSVTIPPQTTVEMLQTAVPLHGPSLQQMTSKSSEDPAYINQVEDSQLSTTPKPTSVKDEQDDDELVRELENLHKTSLSVFSPVPDVLESSISTTIGPNFEVDTEENAEIEKKKIKTQMAEEVEELKRLGETEEGIMNALHLDSFKVKKEYPREATHKLRELDKNSGEHQTVKRVLTDKQERNFSKTEPNHTNLLTFHSAEAPRQIYMNNTFLGMHINLPPMNQRILRRHYGYRRNPMTRNNPFYYGGFRNNIQNFHLRNHQNVMLRNRMYPHTFQQDRPHILGPVRGNAYTVSESANRHPPDNPATHHYPKLNPKTIYMPYPLHENPEPKGIRLNEAPTTASPNSGKSTTEFSDEMKRQLRDGKVILLSDNVVRSNFTTESREGENPKAENTNK